NVGDTFDYLGTTVFADEVFVGPLGALRVRENSSCEAANSIVVEGLLQVDFGATFSSIDPMIEGSLPSSWLRGAGTLVGFVGWRGCLKPSGPLEIQGQLSLLPYDGAEQARFLWKIRDVAQPSLTVTGPAILSGTLQIDASDATIGDEAMILRAGNLIGDFKNIQTVGLPPQFAMLVQRVQGGFYEEIRANVVPIGQLLGYGDSTSYPLTLIPQDAVSADFDGDGIEDLAISLSGGETESGAIVIFRGTGSGLQQVLQLNPGIDPRGIDAGDINLDGKIDLVVALAGDDAIRELRNTTTSGISFNALAPVPVGDKPVDVSLGNFIVDGTELAGSKLDAFVAVELSQEFTFVKNSGGTLGDGGTSGIPSPGGLPTSTGGGDTDNDRVDDGVGGTTGGGTVIPGGTSGSAFTPIFIPTPHPVTSIEVFDITGDGIDDVVASLDATSPRPTPPGTPEVFDTVAIINATFASNGAAYLLNLYDFGRQGRSLSKGDFDLDGDEDLAFASVPAAGGPASLRVVRNDMGPGGALLTELAPPAIAGEVTVVETISIDGNGDDVVVAGPTNLASDSQVTLQRFAEPSVYGDLTGDGIINALDLKVLLSQWGNPGSGDLNLDGQVLGADLAILLYLWTFPPAS
ncbi:MAG: FG-GAP-like repeat-containing protein, partial [Planctomycetota bacterium]